MLFIIIIIIIIIDKRFEFENSLEEKEHQH
jgi:hypothetical protein